MKFPRIRLCLLLLIAAVPIHPLIAQTLSLTPTSPFRIGVLGSSIGDRGQSTYWKVTTHWSKPPASIYVYVTAPSQIDAHVMCGRRECAKTPDGLGVFIWGSSTSVPPAVKVVLTPQATAASGAYNIKTRVVVKGTTTEVTDTRSLQILAAPSAAPSGVTYGSLPLIPNKAKWESTMKSLADKWCIPNEKMSFGTSSQVWYYDGARVFYQAADYLRESKYSACALNIARQYRDYVLASSAVPSYRVFPHGLWMAYERTRDVSFRNAAVKLADVQPPNIAQWVWNAPINMRDTAYALEAAVMAQARAGGGYENEWLQETANMLIGIFRMELGRGYFVNNASMYQQIFMDGLGMEALIQYYELTKDRRVPPLIKEMLDWIWMNAWTGTQLLINPNPPGPMCDWGCLEGNSDLINLTAPAYAWYFRYSGNTTYRSRGDALFSHALDIPITWNGKIFSQNYRWSFDYVDWRELR